MPKDKNIKGLYKKLQRGDLTLIAKHLGMSKQSVLDVVNGKFWNNRIYKAIELLANQREIEFEKQLKELKAAISKPESTH